MSLAVPSRVGVWEEGGSAGERASRRVCRLLRWTCSSFLDSCVAFATPPARKVCCWTTEDAIPRRRRPYLARGQQIAPSPSSQIQTRVPNCIPLFPFKVSVAAVWDHVSGHVPATVAPCPASAARMRRTPSVNFYIHPRQDKARRHGSVPCAVNLALPISPPADLALKGFQTTGCCSEDTLWLGGRWR